MPPAEPTRPNRPLARYRAMQHIRIVEDGIAERYKEQEMRCPAHLSTGQEATAVGVCHALDRDDRAFGTHRSHALYLAKGGDLKAMLSEIYGKADGCIGGRGGSMHLMDLAVGMMASVPIVGSCIPLAVGAALADSLDGRNTVSLAFFGDAAIEEGVFHESANFARLRNLPVLFVCENNLYSVYSNLADRQPPRPLTEVARAHDIPAVHADGNDVDAVHAVASEAVARARSGGGPSFLLFDTYRWREHCGPLFDNDIGYRTEAEFQTWKARDPVAQARDKLIAAGALDAEEDARITAELTREIDAAFDHAKAAALPVPDDAWAHVYAPASPTRAASA
jgi:TPP-dependent pyruvate/acetoin dehydrogenase alpha subunit